MHFKNIQKWIIYLLLIGFACYALLLHFYIRNFLSKLCHEGGIVEWFTAIFYFLASLNFIIACKRVGFKNIWYWCIGLLFFIVAGEEISWGQRLFGFATPEILQNVNIQKEITIHNIEVIHGNIRWIGLLVVSGICFIIPITNRFIATLRRFYKRMKIPIYPPWLTGTVIIAILFMAIPRLLFNEKIFNFDEIGKYV